MRTRLLIAVVVIVVVAVFWVVWEPSLSPVDPPEAASFDDAQIERGRMLAGIGNCDSCHTASPERPLAGGVGFHSEFGTLYSSNITPHPERGIGRWSQAAFARAMRDGVARDGAHLFPAFPYTHFTKLQDDDLAALYAYIMTREPVAYTPPANDLKAPYNLRVLQAGWKLLFFKPGRYQTDTAKSNQWNRGAYLAEGLGHCTACHTPRNQLGAEIEDEAYSGAVIDNWYAPSLNDEQTVPVPWSEKTLYDYLRNGQSDYHGVAVGSMGDVVHAGLNRAADEDIQAMAVYLVEKNNMLSADNAETIAASQIRSSHLQKEGLMGHGEHVYQTACASCHYNTPENPQALRADLSLNSTVSAPDPINLLRVTLEGVGVDEGTPGVVMPGFAALSDKDLISLAHYLRSRYPAQSPWDNLESRLEALRQ